MRSIDRPLNQLRSRIGDHSRSCMESLQLFNFEGQDLRVIVGDDGEPWFVAADVARALGYRDAANAVRCLKDHHRGTRSVSTPSGVQRMTVVSESGLYRLVMRSDLPAAEPFQEWVTAVVLPSIRKTGRYSLAPEPNTIALPQTYAEALRALADQVEATAAAEAKAAALEPPARAWSSLADTSQDYDVGRAAKILSRDPAISIGRQRLFDRLVEWGLVYLEKDRRRNVYTPYQQHVDAGRFVLRLGGRWQNPKTEEWHAGSPQLRITVKGLEFLHQKLGGVGALQFDDGPANTGGGVVLAS